ncbi:hypothetical protein Z946_2266 [Sulfitobacter noctilucicola]|uniref:Uncharacterized protein n=1 Tax=Sulfitobacter noctilucicola TaxID=1342301 RepID=A0A7W6Q4W6_9RHOB|nr:hypothetical protein [Sulfitobacter noctilucicola]KIN63395.1 hypothetical protein Z946_2266 [Sulfitobacter noctilucicola]MBB4175088.1 hypothetical protein [Sulfitobacter noctilucicola]
MKSLISALLAIFISLLASVVVAQTAEHPNFPVVVLDRDDGTIAIAGKIDFRTPLAFENTLAEVPNASVLILDSPGGGVHSALSIASRVRRLGLTTVILNDSQCLSACAFIFLAGMERLAWGDLGVHQISASEGEGNLVGGQFALADIMDALDEYDTPSELVGMMLRTPPEDMYTLSSEEKQQFGFLQQRREPSNVPQPPLSRVDLANPETWRGKVVTGELVSSGKRWFASLNVNGTTVFEFASGKRSFGHYIVSDGAVCFRLDDNPQFACRRPVASQTGIRWYDEKGNFQSVIVGVEDNKIGAVRMGATLVPAVSEYIHPGECALIVASRPTVIDARNYVLQNISDRRFLKTFRSKNGWIAISIGTLKFDQVDAVLTEWKQSGRIPWDSYCSTGKSYQQVINLGLN